MLRKIFHFLSNHKLIIFVCFILAAIPFFWFKPGYIDLGGDSSRLYFYDPWHFLENFVLNIFHPDTIGMKNDGAYMLPFVFFLIFLKTILQSSWLVNTVFNSMNIVIAFLSLYAISLDFIKAYGGSKKVNVGTYLGAIFSGLFYVLAPISSQAGWDLALIIQTERFVYPLIFWLFLQYINTAKSIYVVFILLITVLFSQNFSWVSLPNMISFFLFSLIYLFLYAYLVKKKSIRIKPLIIGFILFLVLQSFHILPLISNLLDKNSDISGQLLQGSIYQDVINYIGTVGSYTQNGYQIIGVTPFSTISFVNSLLVIFPLLILFSLMKNKSITLLLPVLFFAVLYFMVTAKITNIGFSFYKILFRLPGFVMFRDFYGRWLEIFLLFYSLLIGFGIYTFISKNKLGVIKKALFFCFLLIALILNALPFLQGQIVNRVLTKDTGVVVKSRIKIDNETKNMLSYFYKNDLGRNLYLPITDFAYEIIASKGNDGAYLGPSMVGNLTGVNDLSSDQVLLPFSQSLYKAASVKNFSAFSNIFPLLGIKTVLYNSNPYVYDTFQNFPYSYVKLHFPNNQKDLGEFIKNLPLIKNQDFGKYYHLYNVNNSLHLPILYVATQVKEIPDSLSSNDKKVDYVLNNFTSTSSASDIRKVFLSSNNLINNITVPTIKYKKINSGKYLISVNNVSGPYVLVLSSFFNKNWNLFATAKSFTNERISQSFFDGNIIEYTRENSLFDSTIFNTLFENSIANSRHLKANAYANAWYIVPEDNKRLKSYTITLEMTDNRYMYAGLVISFLGILMLAVWVLIIIKNKSGNKHQ